MPCTKDDPTTLPTQPTYAGLKPYDTRYWTYDGASTSCVGLYDDVIRHMRRHHIPVPNTPPTREEQP